MYTYKLAVNNLKCEAFRKIGKLIKVKLLFVASTRYRNDPKFSDRQVWANSAEEQSDLGLHCLLLHLHHFDKIL